MPAPFIEFVHTQFVRLLRRVLRRSIWLFTGAISATVLAGCATLSPRNAVPEASLERIEVDGFRNIRSWGDAASGSPSPGRALDLRSGSDYKIDHQPVSNILAISGGAEDGAFGAGLLVGWSEAGTRPAFDVVTGVSAGALMAPFAFLGKRHDNELREIFTTYGQKDIFKLNLSGLIAGSALADDTPLSRLIEKYVDKAFLEEIARERRKGRILLVGTTDLDAQRPVLWDMGRIAISQSQEALVLFRKVLLASATLPGVFAPIRIQVRADGQEFDELHVDGGVTRQVFLAPSLLATARFNSGIAGSARPQLYIIRNGKIAPEWQQIDESVIPITRRSLSTLIKNQGIGDLYRIYAITKRDDIGFHLASIPSDFRQRSEQPFDRSYMIALFECGLRFATRRSGWEEGPPGLEHAAAIGN